MPMEALSELSLRLLKFLSVSLGWLKIAYVWFSWMLKMKNSFYPADVNVLSTGRTSRESPNFKGD